ncbi:hypothetical protein C8Q74DRAFT_510671 [Fomes fomentarius]|nr:hypothetical protein C8Q74DRAFT_510671 [Fomes fomentarius]
MAACHISLAQPHILDEIFASFRTEIPSFKFTAWSEQLRTNNSTLANAALTCRAFAESASAVLWSAMHTGLIPLLLSLSNFKLDSGNADHEKYPTYVRAPLHDSHSNSNSDSRNPPPPTPKKITEGGVSPSEWARFEVLARRIRSLSYVDPVAAKGQIDPTVVHLLVAQYSEGPLLPNLQVLAWIPSGPQLEQQLLLETLCQTQTLTQLIFPAWKEFLPEAWNGGHCFDDSDMAHVARVCPGLRDLVIDLDPVAWADVIPPTFYSSFHGLRSTRVLLSQPNHIRALAMLPHLESLVINTRHSDADNGLHVDHDTGSASTITPPFRGFHALRTLEVQRCFNPSSASKLLLTITSPMLLVVIMSLDLGRGSPDAFIRFIETVCGLPSAQQLRTLHVARPFARMLSRARQAGWRWELSFREAAGALLQLHNLRDVILDPTWRIWSITDDDVRAMQQAWPHIRSLGTKCFYHSSMVESRRQPDGVSVDHPALNTLCHLRAERPQSGGPRHGLPGDRRG